MILTDIQQLLQDDVWGLLSSDSSFQYVPVLRARTPLERDESGAPVPGVTTMIQDQLENALAGVSQKGGKGGIACLVMLPDMLDADSANLPSPLGELELRVRVIENRLFNEGTTGTGISALALANHIWSLLHFRPLGMCGAPTPQRRVIEESTLPDQRRVVDVVLLYPANGLTPLSRVALPAISQAGAVITLTCATSGASIYYTLDGSWPGSGNPDAVLYTAPVTLEAGSHDLRVAAQKADHSPSIDLSQTITVNP